MYLRNRQGLCTYVHADAQIVAQASPHSILLFSQPALFVVKTKYWCECALARMTPFAEVLDVQVAGHASQLTHSLVCRQSRRRGGHNA